MQVAARSSTEHAPSRRSASIASNVRRPQTRWRVASACSIRCGLVRLAGAQPAPVRRTRPATSPSSEVTADHVNQRVLQPDCRRAAVEFGALREVRRSGAARCAASRPQIAARRQRRRARPSSADQGSADACASAAGQIRQHPGPLPLRLGQPAAVVHVDTPVNVDQFATAPQSGDVVIGAGGGQYLAT